MEKKKRYKDPRYSDEAYEKFREYQKEYVKNHYKQYPLRFHTEKEKDVIEYLSGIEGITQYLKNLIREDMKKNQKQ